MRFLVFSHFAVCSVAYSRLSWRCQCFLPHQEVRVTRILTKLIGIQLLTGPCKGATKKVEPNRLYSKTLGPAELGAPGEPNPAKANDQDVDKDETLAGEGGGSSSSAVPSIGKRAASAEREEDHESKKRRPEPPNPSGALAAKTAEEFAKAEAANSAYGTPYL